jgi:hypothetical protein
MTIDKRSGQEPFVFTSREDLQTLPAAARPFEVNLHGGFAIDHRYLLKKLGKLPKSESRLAPMQIGAKTSEV